MLRYQLNPHFLFNTLNAISTLILDNQNRTANHAVMRLSEFLRYTLDQDPVNKVTLRKEIEALNLYLNTERLRFGERLRLEYAVEEPALDGAGAEPAAAAPDRERREIRHLAARGRRLDPHRRSPRGTMLEITVIDDGPGVRGRRCGRRWARRRAAQHSRASVGVCTASSTASRYSTVTRARASRSGFHSAGGESAWARRSAPSSSTTKRCPGAAWRSGCSKRGTSRSSRSAANGREALAAIATHRPDLGLPRHPDAGNVRIRAAGAAAAGLHAAVVFVTAFDQYADPRIRRAGRRLPAQAGGDASARGGARTRPRAHPSAQRGDTIATVSSD